MTISLENPPQASGRHPATMPAYRRKGRIGTVALLIGSLLCAGALREVVARRQDAMTHTRGVASSRSTLGSMDSFALALFLGGLRGPLVMFLWSTSESQKSDRDLEDFDTKIEWIRLLQPEFDTVHMFQIWNKAYNISVMMASPANKYSVIIEALEYADNVDKERPGDVNILNAISTVYGGKLGSNNLPEFPFYSRQFRLESMTPENRKLAYPRESVHFARLDKWKPFLDSDNQILPQYLTPTRPRPADLPADKEWNDGSDLQFLKGYGPFPYGISPLAMSYNYAKRAEIAISTEGQKPLQLSSMVIDSRPALQLKFWAEDELRRGRSYEDRVTAMASAGTADRPARTDPAQVDEALKTATYYYKSATRLSSDAIREYERHLHKPDYVGRRSTYESHIADMRITGFVATADAQYIKASLLTSDKDGQRKMLSAAAENYYKAQILAQTTSLRFYLEDEAVRKLHGAGVLPASVKVKADIAGLDERLIPQIYAAAMGAATSLPPLEQQYVSERGDYDRIVVRCLARIEAIRGQAHQ